MNIKQLYIVGGILLVTTVPMQAQSIGNFIKDERKKTLLEGVRPARIPNQTAPHRQSMTDTSYVNNIIDIQRRRKEGMIDSLNIVKNFDVSPYLTIPKELILKIEPGTPTKTMLIDGKFKTVPVNYELEQKLDEMSQRHRLQGVSISTGMGGLNLSGFKEKKMSKKAKDILEQVFGIIVEEK